MSVPLPSDAADIPNYTWREYGHRAGFWRIADVLDALDIKASVALNAAVGENFPILIDRIKDSDWEIIAHSYKQEDLLSNFAHDRKGEEALIRKTLKTLKRVTGVRPKGWLSPNLSPTCNTLSILAKEGFEYFCDYQNDDKPYLLEVGGRRMVCIPFGPEMTDYRMIRFGYTPKEFYGMVADGFKVLYEEGRRNGRLLHINVHPHVTGWPYRIEAFKRTLSYMKKHKDVWFARGFEISEWCLNHL